MILNRQRRVSLALGPLAKFLERVERRLRLPGEAITVCLVGASAMARLNRSYRGKHGPTDVLSFAADGNAGRNVNKSGQKKRRMGLTRPLPPTHPSAPSGSGDASVARYLGDIAISPAIARRNARRFGRSLEDEMRVLILHGVLHLLGYDHESDDGAMERRERRLRQLFGLR